jgi:hypothetical protein
MANFCLPLARILLNGACSPLPCRNWRPAKVDGLPEVFTGGWVGYAGYDTVRYVYGSECLLRNGSNHSASAVGPAVQMLGQKGAAMLSSCAQVFFSSAAAAAAEDVYRPASSA